MIDLRQKCLHSTVSSKINDRGPHHENTPMQYTAIFHGCKNVHFQMNFFNIFLIFAQNIDCEYTLEPPEAVLTSTHDLCFRAKIRQKCIPL